MRALTDPNLEFDVFEMARQKLVEVFISEGHERLEAEKIAVYIVEGLQHVPKLLNVLTRIKLPTKGHQFVNSVRNRERGVDVPDRLPQAHFSTNINAP